MTGHVPRDVNLLLHTFTRAGMLVQCAPDNVDRQNDYIKAMHDLLTVKTDITNTIERSTGIMSRILKFRAKREVQQAQGQLDLELKPKA